MRPSQALNAAADLILKGWGRDGYALNKDNFRVAIMAQDAVKFCPVGALARALGGSWRAADEILDICLVPLLPMAVGTHQRTVRRWNDEVAISAEDVAKLMRQAADVAKQKENEYDATA